jgi:hypothetical protein
MPGPPVRDEAVTDGDRMLFVTCLRLPGAEAGGPVPGHRAWGAPSASPWKDRA